MPFQGNPNAGQPDPALLNLLFQQKQQREEMAYKQQQDALAAQRQAQLDAAEEARKDAEHRMKIAKDTFEMMNKAREQETAIGETQANNRQAKDQVAQAYPFISTPGVQVQGPDGGSAMEYGALPDQSIQNAYTQQQVGQQLDEPLNARMAALATVLQDIPGMEQYAQTLPGQGMQAEMTRQRLGQEKTQEQINTEARSNREADRRRSIEFQNTRTLAREAETRLLERGPKQFIEGNNQIRSLLSRADKLQEKDPVKAAQLRADASGLAAIRDSKLTAGQPETAVTNAKTMIELQQRLDLGVNLRSDLEEILRVESGGATAQAEKFITNAAGLVNDFGKLFTGENNQFEQIMNSQNVDSDTRERLTNILVRGYDPERQRELTTAELAMQRLRWVLVVEGSRGRVSLTEIKGLGNIIGVHDFFTSQIRTQGRVRAGIKSLDESNNSLQRSIAILRPDTEFDKDGRVRLKVPNIGGEGAQTEAPTVEVTPEPTATEIISDKNATPKEVVDRLREKAMQRWGVK